MPSVRLKTGIEKEPRSVRTVIRPPLEAVPVMVKPLLTGSPALISKVFKEMLSAFMNSHPSREVMVA